MALRNSSENQDNSMSVAEIFGEKTQTSDAMFNGILSDFAALSESDVEDFFSAVYFAISVYYDKSQNKDADWITDCMWNFSQGRFDLVEQTDDSKFTPECNSIDDAFDLLDRLIHFAENYCNQTMVDDLESLYDVCENKTDLSKKVRIGNVAVNVN